MEHEALTREIIGGAMRVHNALGFGFVESIYQNALAWELRTSELSVERERRLQVRYRDLLVGEFSADIVVEGCVIVETKSVRTLAPAHEAQLVNYLTATGIDVGLLLNFGSHRLEFRRKSRIYRPRAERPDNAAHEAEAPPSPIL
jgi:GxxExxY protein